MNKMNLPAPFRPGLPTPPPAVPAQSVPKRQAGDLSSGELELGSSDEEEQKENESDAKDVVDGNLMGFHTLAGQKKGQAKKRLKRLTILGPQCVEIISDLTRKDRFEMDAAVDGFGARVPEVEFHSSSTAGAECVDGDLPSQGKEQFEEEIDALVRLFNEEASQGVVRYRKDRDNPANVQRKKIATFLEGSRLSFSALVKDIYQKLSGENDQDQSKSGAVTMASVKSSILSLGERLSFGITNPDADVLEDDIPGSLWCWEVRDVKLLSKVFRDDILARRRWRKKIGERIAALSATIDALRSEGGEIALAARLKAAQEALAKVDDESVIRSAKLMWQQKKESAISGEKNSDVIDKDPLGEQPSNGTHLEAAPSKGRRKSDPDEKEKLRQEKMLKRQQMEHEKEQKRKGKEEADRKKQLQKLQDETEKEQKRKEKEEGERRKQEKRLQDEVEKEQKREAERKKQLALKKQASFMDRFLVKREPQQAKDQPGCGQGQTQQHSESQAALSSPVAAEMEKRESVSPILQAAQNTAVVVARMDIELKGGDDVVLDAPELLQSHVLNWLSVRNKSKSGKNHRWGVRRKPKVSVYRELRLSAGTVADARVNSQDDGHVRTGPHENSSSTASHLKRFRGEFDSPENFIDLTEDVVNDCSPNSPLEEGRKSSSSSSSRCHQLRNKKRKLLQFDKSHRPPYYGTFSKKSEYIKPRNPLKQDPDLDYEVDSDEEWEEEDPGESLSDIEKDEEDEKGEIESIEDEEDDFVVPDGYLSENEGVAMEDAERGVAAAGGSFANQSPVTPVHQNVMTMGRLRKVLDNATEHAIRSNHPLVISNLGQLPGCEELSSSQFASNRTETLCLEALRMRVLVPNLVIGAC